MSSEPTEIEPQRTAPTTRTPNHPAPHVYAQAQSVF